MSHSSVEIQVVAAVLHRRGQVLLVRRGPGISGAGFWEFPGGKLEPGESPEQALKREIQEELGVSIQVGSFIGEIVHAYPTKTIRLCVFWATSLHEGLVLSEHDASKWLAPQEIIVEELSEADRPFVAKLIAQIHSF